ncbi:hypothetical protein FRZ61_33610 [Hypericibacter adhaerens]|uniref:Uncharacterized protein n=1 Tax=Hypericibacter adhaerens TaxID=2602016 RepID=A0A5J6N3K2_9PROT|nr:hypothetical protein FRZ61_33610 [Hypericibacter adhaerens]
MLVGRLLGLGGRSDRHEQQAAEENGQAGGGQKETGTSPGPVPVSIRARGGGSGQELVSGQQEGVAAIEYAGTLSCFVQWQGRGALPSRPGWEGRLERVASRRGRHPPVPWE